MVSVPIIFIILFYYIVNKCLKPGQETTAHVAINNAFDVGIA